MPDHSTVPVVAILGQWRSGTSALAGVLHHLGFYFGEQVGLLGEHVEHRNTWEALDLVALMGECFRQPQMQPLLSESEISARLGSWIDRRQADAAAKGYLGVAMKHPALSAAWRALKRAQTDVILLRTDRSVAASWESMQRIGWNWPEQAARVGLERQYRGAVESGAEVFPFPGYLDARTETVDRIADLVGTDLPSDRRASAIESLVVAG